MSRSLPINMSGSNQRGFGLIEVLVAVLVLAIGLLGMGSLQTTGLQQTSEARNRSQAVFLAQDIIERARANRPNVASYGVAEGNAAACNRSFTIDNSNVSTNDLAEWKNSLACLLPGGNGAVEVSNEQLIVTVTWDPQSGYADEGSIVVEAEI